jgi:hypothetical protein
MKHAIIGPRGQINRVLDEANLRTVEITDEQATAALELIEAKRPAILFEGRITNPLIERDAGNVMRWDEEAGAWSVTPRVIPTPLPRKISAWQAKAALAMTPHPSRSKSDLISYA